MSNDFSKVFDTIDDEFFTKVLRVAFLKIQKSVNQSIIYSDFAYKE